MRSGLGMANTITGDEMQNLRFVDLPPKLLLQCIQILNILQLSVMVFGGTVHPEGCLCGDAVV